MNPDVRDLAYAMFVNAFPLVVNAAAAYIMIRHSNRLAEWARSRAGAPEPDTPAPRIDLMATAFAVVGVVMALLAAPQLSAMAVLLPLGRLSPIDGQLGPMLTRQYCSVAVRFSLQFVLGVALFWKAHALAAYWRRIQNTSGPTDTPAA